MSFFVLRKCLTKGNKSSYHKIREVIIVEKNKKSTQDWIIIENITKEGFIKIKNKNIYLKVLKIEPINFNLKSDLEKEAILKSYKIFLKTCNFNLQILIHTKKEDISKIVQNIKKNKNEKINTISSNYIKFLEKINSEKKSSSKNYYIIIDEKYESEETDTIYYKLNEKYYKIKECLNRCGNKVKECNKKEVINILYYFFNAQKNLEQGR